MSQQLFDAMKQSVIDGDEEQAAELAQQALAQGVDPLAAINDGYVPGISYVGDQFGAGEMFLPDLMLAAEAMKAAVAVLEPEMERRGMQRQMLARSCWAR
jgi:trimethylamine corrinoid protein